MSEEDFVILEDKPRSSGHAYFGRGKISESSTASTATKTSGVENDTEEPSDQEEGRVQNPVQDDLPPGWTARLTTDGDTIYMHSETNAIRTVKPVEVRLPPPKLKPLPKPLKKKENSFWRLLKEKQKIKKEMADEENNRIAEFTKKEKRKFDFGKVKSKSADSSLEMKDMKKKGLQTVQETPRLRGPSGVIAGAAMREGPLQGPPRPSGGVSINRISDLYKDDDKEIRVGNDIGSFSSVYGNDVGEDQEGWVASNPMRKKK
jgi:hypothetical protein